MNLRQHIHYSSLALIVLNACSSTSESTRLSPSTESPSPTSSSFQDARALSCEGKTLNDLCSHQPENFVPCHPALVQPKNEELYICGAAVPTVAVDEGIVFVYRHRKGCGQVEWQRIQPSFPSFIMTWTEPEQELIGLHFITTDTPSSTGCTGDSTAGTSFECATVETQYCVEKTIQVGAEQHPLPADAGIFFPPSNSP